MAEELQKRCENAAECSHQDATRKTVSVTAHGVAYMRGLESTLCPDNPLFYDPYATILGGDAGKTWTEEVAARFGENLRDMSAQNAFYSSIAIRTKKIDTTIQSTLDQCPGVSQICTLGAGLDTRPWRLALQTTQVLNYYELDFPELFDYKLPILQQHGAKCPYNYHDVRADLSLESWPDVLSAAGFDRTRPTIWLLEGLTGYLTKDENERMFKSIACLSAEKSSLIATFITPPAKEKLMIPLHRYAPEDPLALMRSCGGWEGTMVDLYDIAKEYNRLPEDEKLVVRGYMLATVHV
ncbi:class I SAM-dependent methyltransferase [archaeon]|nr:MAG: class I SAM-dependent methyltransferase [archaeon]